jgi:hypothetical protein
MTTLRIIRRTRNIFYERHDFLKEIPNAEVKMTVKKDLNDTEAVFTETVMVDFNTGDFTVEISEANTEQNTGVYYYDIIAEKDNKRYLIAQGKLEIALSASSITS